MSEPAYLFTGVKLAGLCLVCAALGAITMLVALGFAQAMRRARREEQRRLRAFVRETRAEQDNELEMRRRRRDRATLRPYIGPKGAA